MKNSSSLIKGDNIKTQITNKLSNDLRWKKCYKTGGALSDVIPVSGFGKNCS